MSKSVTREEYCALQRELAARVCQACEGADISVCAEVLVHLWVGTARAMGFNDDTIREQLDAALSMDVAQIAAVDVN